jgi:hypothetical protein
MTIFMDTIHIQQLDVASGADGEFEQPKIAFLYVPDQRPVFGNPQQLSAWMQSFSELDMLCHGTAFFVQPPEQNDGFQIIPAICQQIKKIYDDFDGFVIVLPRDRVLTISAILSLLVTRTGKPVVCTSDYATGMQTRYRDYYSIAFKGDLVNTAHVGSANIGTVVTMAGVEILHPALATVAYNDERPFLTSATNTLMGVVDFGIHLYPRTPKRSTATFQFQQWSLDAVQRVVIDDHKLAAVKAKDFAVRPDTRGLIAEISGVAPLSLLAALPQTIPVLITSDAGVQLSFNGAVLPLDTTYTNQAIAAQFTRALTQHKRLIKSAPTLLKAMQQQVFPALTAGV